MRALGRAKTWRVLLAVGAMAAGCNEAATGPGDRAIQQKRLELSPTDGGLFELDKNATNELLAFRAGTLQGAINSTDTELVLCREEAFDPIVVLIEAEQIAIIDVASATGGGCSFTKRRYSILRGINGTQASDHSTGAIVSRLVTQSLPGPDWDQVFEQVTADPNETGNDDKCIALGAVECAFVNDPAGTSIFTTGGSKDDLDISSWRHTTGSVPDSDEILNAYAAKFVQDGQQLLFFGADREAQNGSKDFGFWFTHKQITLKPDGTFDGEHTAPDPVNGLSGDILILGTFTQGGEATTIRVFEWVGTGGDATANGTVGGTSGSFGDCLLNPGNDGCGTVNNTSIPAPWPYKAKGVVEGFIPKGGAFEGGINLSSLGLEGCFSSFVAETRSSPSVDAQLKDFVLGSFEACGSTLTTTPASGAGANLTDSNGNGLPDVSIGTGIVGVRDSASLAVTGTPTWSGTLDFYLCGPLASGTCETGGTLISTHPVNQGTSMPVLSSAATLSSAGRYCWRGVFTSATAGVPGSSDSSAGECFEVLPVTALLDTQAVASPVNFGQAVQDNATVSGLATQPGTPILNGLAGAAAGGTIVFTLLKADCSTVATGTGTNPQQVTVSGNGTYGPVSFTPDAPGTYHWKAQYIPASGDPNNLGTTHNALCTDTDETVVVNQVQTTITTRQFVLPQDKAKITAPGGGNLAGNVTFELYPSALSCNNSDTALRLYSEGPISISGASPQFATTNNLTVRVSTNSTAYWRVTYVSTNQAQTNASSVCVENTSVSFAGDDGTISIP